MLAALTGTPPAREARASTAPQAACTARSAVPLSRSTFVSAWSHLAVAEMWLGNHDRFVCQPVHPDYAFASPQRMVYAQLDDLPLPAQGHHPKDEAHNASEREEPDIPSREARRARAGSRRLRLAGGGFPPVAKAVTAIDSRTIWDRVAADRAPKLRLRHIHSRVPVWMEGLNTLQLLKYPRTRPA
jgi:hypothetical protein